jgi:SAM-dependent methyltransferase
VPLRRRREPPLPPPDLVFLVAGTTDIEWFKASGSRAADIIRDLLLRHDVEMADLSAFLDFGCGVGRVTRWWSSLSGPEICGSDYNPILVDWCTRNLRFASFSVNGLTGQLEYPEARFDLVYALSVLTHLSEANGHGWVAELGRVLRPGGLLIFSTHGAFHADGLPAEAREQFERGGFVIYGEEHEGTNTCTTLHPERYVRDELARGFEIVDFIPEGALGNPRQDLWLLRKPA